MNLEPDGGNVYAPHQLMIHSGRYWRCAHGVTGFGSSMKWVGCWRCALKNPVQYLRWKNLWPFGDKP